MADPRKIYPLDISEFAPAKAAAAGETRALEWLENACGSSTVNLTYDGIIAFLRPLKVMLARPAMPEELTPDMIETLREVFIHANGDYREGLRTVWREARRRLAAPKTKTVWFVTGGTGEATVGLTLDEALGVARTRANLGCAVTIRPEDVSAD